MKQPAYTVILAGPADRDFVEIMDWSAEQFGAAAADRYETLIGRALTDVGEDPFRPGARQQPELPEDIYIYHLASSRERVSGDRVKASRHFLLCRVVSLRVEVLRILQNSRDMAHHLPEGFAMSRDSPFNRVQPRPLGYEPKERSRLDY